MGQEAVMISLELTANSLKLTYTNFARGEPHGLVDLVQQHNKIHSILKSVAGGNLQFMGPYFECDCFLFFYNFGYSQAQFWHHS